MKVVYTENEKRHIFESETGHMSTFLKERVTKEQAEVLFQAQLANEGITSPAVTSEEPATPAPEAPVAPTEESAPADVTPTPENA
jgi:hypothetical protein